ncbi:pullulanase-associated domain-containing protein [Vibrio sp. 03_296]|uniref:pullulanase-associated domain-containing protein n=1 Tax=Vibrio sp. 03_296 TaxID=2024409 RepID=UPI0034E8ED72
MQLEQQLTAALTTKRRYTFGITTPVGGYAETDEGHDDWGTGMKPTGVDDKFGAYWDLQVRSEATQCINFIPRVDGAKPWRLMPNSI